MRCSYSNNFSTLGRSNNSNNSSSNRSSNNNNLDSSYNGLLHRRYQE